MLPGSTSCLETVGAGADGGRHSAIESTAPESASTRPPISPVETNPDPRAGQVRTPLTRARGPARAPPLPGRGRHHPGTDLSEPVTTTFTHRFRCVPHGYRPGQKKDAVPPLSALPGVVMKVRQVAMTLSEHERRTLDEIETGCRSDVP